MTRNSVDRSDATAKFFAGIQTLPALLCRRAELTPSAAAYVTQNAHGVWVTQSWAEFRDEVAALSVALARHGVGPGARIGILAGSSLGWETAQMAALACGAMVAGIDPYYPDALINELIPELALTGLIVQDAQTLQRLSPPKAVHFRFVALINGGENPGAGITTLAALRMQGSPVWQPLAEPTAPALFAYSSGSTLRPKPVLYTHAQVVHACRCLLDAYPEISAGARFVCWLPLANLYQRMMNLCAMAKGGATYIVEDPRRVMDALPEANPEVLAAVPRFCEKLHDAMMERIGRRPLLARLVEHAIALRGALSEEQAGRLRLSPMKRTAAIIADYLVLARLRTVMGKRLKFILSGSAPMPPWLAKRFEAIGIPVLEAYGVSENLVPIAANRLTQRKVGTVGKPIGDNEVRIAADGEVQVRGRGVFIPSLVGDRTHSHAFTDDGFLATGDLGFFDEEGFLTLRGRRVEAFKNAQGRWVNLPCIEALLRRLPGIAHAAVIRMPSERLIAILALDQGPNPFSTSNTAEASAVERRLAAALREQLAGALASLPRAMWPMGFLVACKGFSPATGELTTNLKLRRTAIAEKFSQALCSLQGECDPQGSVNDAVPLKFV
jgi:long-chain acyl-CoA synthetase